MKFSNNYLELNEEANEFRRRNGIGEYDSIDIFTLVLDKVENLTIIFLDFDDNFSGCCTTLKNQKVIFVNKNHSLGRQRFTVAHELYHLLQDIKTVNRDTKNQKNIEYFANQFASCLLLPHGALNKYEDENNIIKWDLSKIIQAEQYFQISHKALLNRLIMLERINKEEYDLYLSNIKRNAIEMGYPLKLYEPFTNEELVLGNYIKLVIKVWDDKKISKGKKDELLLDAFYGKLVYNEEIGDLNE